MLKTPSACWLKKMPHVLRKSRRLLWQKGPTLAWGSWVYSFIMVLPSDHVWWKQGSCCWKVLLRQKLWLERRKHPERWMWSSIGLMSSAWTSHSQRRWPAWPNGVRSGGAYASNKSPMMLGYATVSVSITARGISNKSTQSSTPPFNRCAKPFLTIRVLQ